MEIAEESIKTKRAREKLKKQLAAIDKKMKGQTPEKKLVEIHRWISRHADDRVVLRNKSISLFDENENAALISQKITKLAEQVKIKFFQESEGRKRSITSGDALRKKK